MAVYCRKDTKKYKNTALFAVLVLMLVSAAVMAGCTAADEETGGAADAKMLKAPGDSEEFKEKLDLVIKKDEYEYSSWGIVAADTDTGEVLLSMNKNMLFTPGSTTKVFTVSTALETLGKDYTFKTPVYYKDKNLVLVASGDMAMGGRGSESGALQYTSSDHVDAGAFGRCILAEGDPLFGLKSLAGQVHDSGITQVTDVAVDARLFEETKLAAEGIITPVVINDNLIDITVTPGKEGEAPYVDWRPKSSAYTIKNSIITGAPDSGMSVDVPEYTGQKVIEITGTIPAGHIPVNMTSNVLAPEEFARNLFIDALSDAGVSVETDAGKKNPAYLLPEKNSYSKWKKAAEYTSPPFSEYAKVTLKVSQNLYANCMLGIIAAHEGYDIVDAGLYLEGEFLDSAGVNPKSLFIGDGEGSIVNRISPDAAISLTKYMAETDSFEVLKDSMPVMGVDGTLASGAEEGEPGYGIIRAKTGTSLAGDMRGEIFAYTRGLLGYMTTEKGNDITFVIYVNNVPGIKSVADISGVVSDVNTVSVLMYQYL